MAIFFKKLCRSFIEEEVIRMKILCLEESRLFTGYWKSYGRQQRTTYRSYSHWTTFGHYDASEFVHPNKDEARSWIEQSKADLKVAAKMLRDKSYSQVCFMSQLTMRRENFEGYSLRQMWYTTTRIAHA